MNRFGKILGTKRQAKIKYLDGEFQVVAPGDFVLCALTEEAILLQDLKYWNVAHQEAYASAALALKAELKYKSEA